MYESLLLFLQAHFCFYHVSLKTTPSNFVFFLPHYVDADVI